MEKLNNKTLLIVDDEVELCELLALQFQRQGFRTLEANTGNAAIEILKTKPVDLVITDIRMPDGTGLDVLKYAKRHHPVSVPVILISSLLELSEVQYLGMGAEAVFMKPVEMKLIQEAVWTALESPRSEKKRQHPRVGVSLKVRVRASADRPAREARVLNLSHGGMFVSFTDFHPSVGDKIQFKLETPFPEPKFMEGTGLIRWVHKEHGLENQSSFGVEFLPLAGLSKVVLKRLVRSLGGEDPDNGERDY